MEQIWILIPLSGIMLGPLMYWMRIKEKQVGMASEMAAEKATHYAARMAELEERLKVVERIVTDGGYETAAQIEALRTPALERSKVQ
jgi:ABC-type phosphate transport system auxiliary subunit